LLPRARQHRALESILESQRQLYNAALEERIGAYRHGVVRSYFDQSRELTVWRQSDAEARSLPVSLQRSTLKRLDAAYRAFFRRIKAGEKPGFPRFKGTGSFDSFGFTDFNGIVLKDGKLRFLGMPGPLRMHLHRPIPVGALLRTCTFRREGNSWTVCIAIDVPAAEPRPMHAAVGIDLGLASFAALSTGEVIPRLASARRAERKLRVAQRAFARKQRGSHGRGRAREVVRRLHAAVRRQRANYLHTASAHLVRSYDLIAVEDLNVRALAKSGLAKAVRDASWGLFNSMLRYKAERAGSRLVEVDCRDTTQTCSSCGTRVPKDRKDRWHECDQCGLSIDRDVNAARNILFRAGVGPGLPNVAG
jgi:putative transposase